MIQYALRTKNEHISAYSALGTDALFLYHDICGVALNNTDSFVFMGCNNYATAREVSLRADVPVETVLTLPIGKEIVFRRGSKAIWTQRYDTYKDEKYLALFGKGDTVNEK